MVLGEAAELGERTEGVLDHPAPRQDGKAMLVGVASFDDLQRESTAWQQRFEPVRQGSGATPIDEDAAQPAEALLEDGRMAPSGAGSD